MVKSLQGTTSTMKNNGWIVFLTICSLGLQVVYNLNKTVGSRVVSVDVLCADCEVPEYQPLQLDQTYGVVLPQYLSDGGNNFTMFEGFSSKILGICFKL